MDKYFISQKVPNLHVAKKNTDFVLNFVGKVLLFSDNKNDAIDMHIHVNRKMSKELIIDVLKKAEKNHIKVLSFVMHNDVFPYIAESPLMELIASDEIAQYYTGKIIAGVEIDCVVDGAQNISQNGYDFNGDIIHVLMYDFDINALTTPGAFYSEEYQQKAFFYDMKILTDGLKKFGFSFPEGFSFVYGVPYQDQLYAFLTAPENAAYKADFEKKLGVDDSVFESKSKFARLLTNNKEGIISKILNKNSKTLLKIQEVIKLASTCGGKLVLAHPARMNGSYIINDYIQTIVQNYGEYFHGIEVEYGLDNMKARDEVIKSFRDVISNEKYKHLIATGGSEFLTFLEQFQFDGESLKQQPGRKVATKDLCSGYDKIKVAKDSLDFNGIYPPKEDENERR